MKDWFYDEFRHVGVDYAQADNADVYDEQMDFRDYDAEVTALLEKLGIIDPGDMVAVDIGCGTGAFSCHAASRFKRVYAVDVSDAMQGIARDKAAASGVENIEFRKAGFLGYAPEEAADVVNTKWALHHLPDYWKQAALRNMNRLLKPGGMLFIADVVFPFVPDFEADIDAFLEDVREQHGTEFMEETKLHIREEFSTFDWIMRGMIERAGFEILAVNEEDRLAYEFVCRKVRDV